MTPLTPEEIELDKKRRVLDRLKDRLADREEEMTDLRALQEQFEAQYTMNVARLYAEFDDIEAQIAEEEYKLVPDDEEIKKKAEELRRKAKESATRAADDEEKKADLRLSFICFFLGTSDSSSKSIKSLKSSISSSSLRR